MNILCPAEHFGFKRSFSIGPSMLCTAVKLVVLCPSIHSSNLPSSLSLPVIKCVFLWPESYMDRLILVYAENVSVKVKVMYWHDHMYSTKGSVDGLVEPVIVYLKKSPFLLMFLFALCAWQITALLA